jgi:hypothetical protein
MSIAGNDNILDIVLPNAQPVSYPPPPAQAGNTLAGAYTDLWAG